MEEFRNLKRVAMNELRKLDAMYANKDEFLEADVKKYDCLMHGLKSQLTAEAMLGAEERMYDDGMSGRSMHGRPHVTYEGGYSGYYPPPMYPPRY